MFNKNSLKIMVHQYNEIQLNFIHGIKMIYWYKKANDLLSEKKQVIKSCTLPFF